MVGAKVSKPFKITKKKNKAGYTLTKAMGYEGERNWSVLYRSFLTLHQSKQVLTFRYAA